MTTGSSAASARPPRPEPRTRASAGTASVRARTASTAAARSGMGTTSDERMAGFNDERDAADCTDYTPTNDRACPRPLTSAHCPLISGGGLRRPGRGRGGLGGALHADHHHRHVVVEPVLLGVGRDGGDEVADDVGGAVGVGGGDGGGEAVVPVDPAVAIHRLREPGGVEAEDVAGAEGERRVAERLVEAAPAREADGEAGRQERLGDPVAGALDEERVVPGARSEERRVEKECRVWLAAHGSTKRA